MKIIRNVISCHHVQETPGAFWRHLGTLGRLYKTMGHQNNLFRKLRFSLTSQYFDEIAAPGPHLRSVWGALVGRHRF